MVEDGDIRETPIGSEFMTMPDYDPGTDDYLKPLFEDCYTMQFENYPVEMQRIEKPEIQDCIDPT